MIIEEAISDLIESLDLVGDRVYPMRLPQDEPLPAVVYQSISRAREESHSGPSGLYHPRIQLNCWDDSYTGAKKLAKRIIQALDGYKGTVGSIKIGKIKVANVLDDQEEETDMFRQIVDIIVWHGEEVVT